MKKPVAIVIFLLGFVSVAVAQTEKPAGLLPVQQFAEKLKAQAILQLIDARSPEEFALNHIPEAINVNRQTDGYETIIKGISPSKPVFVYSIANGRSVALAADLRKKGFNEVYVLDGGIGAWTGSGNTLYNTAKKGLTLDEYNRILANNKLVLVDIGSRYCGSCKKVKPVLETLRQQHGDALTIVEIDLEESPALIASLKTVSSFPYLILYKQGEIVLKRAGLTDLKTELDTKLVAAQ